MKKSILLIPVFAAIAAISACGNSGEKGRTLARIDGAHFTEGDLDLRLSVHDEQKRKQILGDTALRRLEFENFLRNRLHALAAQAAPVGKSKSLKRRYGLVDQRVITQYYFETHLNTNGGYTRARIESFYNDNPGLFKDDSGQVMSLSRALPLVVDTLIARDGDIDSFFQANQRNYVMRPAAEVSIIRTATRKQADAALKALKSGKGGAKFAQTAAKFSNHNSKDNQGSLGRIQQGDYQPEIGPQPLLDSLLFDDKTRLHPGSHSGVLARDGSFLIVRVDSHSPERTPSLAEVRERVVGDFVRQHKTPQGEQVVAALREKHGVRLVSRDRPASEKELRAYYQAHKDQYQTPESFELYHIEGSDQSKLSAAVENVGSLEAFKALAGRISENEMTRAQHGHVGVVKRDFTLPYGIGMMPSLFPILDEEESGKVGEVVENPATLKWHAFWLVRKIEPAVKPFDRVRAIVAEDLRANAVATISPEDTLAVIGGSGKILREEDVSFLREEIPEHVRDRYTTDNLLEYLIIWEVVTDEARARGLDKERKLRAARLQSEDSYWAGVYRDSLLPANWEESPAKLEKTFKANRALFTSDSNARDWKPHARDIAAWLYLTPRDLEIEYHTNPERYMRDSVRMSMAEARPALFANLKPVAYARLDAAVLDKLKKRFKVRIEDPSLLEPSLEPVAETYKKAQDLHYERKLDQALGLYEKLRENFPARAGLQDSVSFGIAQIYIEQERFAQAMSEYRRVSYLYPDSPNDYKAMFMLGFIQAEHLRQDSSAVRSFEAMLKKYPESDLSDDAEWMIENIRSGGALMPALEDDMEDDLESGATSK